MEDIIKNGEYRDITIIVKGRDIKCGYKTDGRKFYIKDFNFDDFFTTEYDDETNPQQATQKELKNYYEQDGNGHRYLSESIWYWLDKEFYGECEWNETFEIIFGIDETNKGTELFNY